MHRWFYVSRNEGLEGDCRRRLVCSKRVAPLKKHFYGTESQTENKVQILGRVDGNKLYIHTVA